MAYQNKTLFAKRDVLSVHYGWHGMDYYVRKRQDIIEQSFQWLKKCMSLDIWRYLDLL
jgi:hypothetical protein